MHYIHTYIHTHTYIHKYIHTYIHTFIHTYIHTYIRTYIYTCIYICTYTHTQEAAGVIDVMESLPGDDPRRLAAQEVVNDATQVQKRALVTKAESKLCFILGKAFSTKPQARTVMSAKLVKVTAECTKETCLFPATWEDVVWGPLVAVVLSIVEPLPPQERL